MAKTSSPLNPLRPTSPEDCGQGINIDSLLYKLEALADPETAAGMAKFGINSENIYGVSVKDLRILAKETVHDHRLAQQLWDTGIHEARILASMIDNPREVTKEQMESWAAHFDSWDICDQCCNNLFRKTPHAWEKAVDWSLREEEFIKRGAFVLIAVLAVHDKHAKDSDFEAMFPLILREAADDRNLVKKAVNWALRQIGKRNARLNGLSIRLAQDLENTNSRSACWVARDALMELQSDWLQEKLGIL